jgi:hypothetical protein
MPTRTLRIACGLALAAAAIIRLAHVGGYFFLFDDFALNGQASTWPLRDLAATPLFGFYRPGFFLLIRAVHALFGWQAPAGYAAVILALHVANTALVAMLTRRLVGAGVAPVVAAALFFVAPWSAEAVFWLSGGFDVLATLGALIALNAAVVFCGDGPGRRLDVDAAWLALMCAGTLVAVFSKESAVVVPGLLALTVVGCPAPVRWARAGLAVGLMLAVAGTYLVVRRAILSSLGGVYGDWFTLMAGAPLVDNLGAFLRSVFFWPGPHDAGMRAVGLMVVLSPVAAASLGILVAASWRRPRIASALLLGTAAALLPVLWVGIAPGSSGGGRVLYLAGAAFAILCATGAQALVGHSRVEARWTAVVAVVMVLGAAVTSLEAQRTVWARAIGLSRASVEAFRPFVGASEPLHIDNLPFWFAEGPYVIKTYAFGYYYHPAAVPPVSATALSLVAVGGRVTVTTRQPEPGAPPAPAAARHVTLPIDVR